MTVQSNLSIHNLSLADLDSYSCVAINRGGMAESEAVLELGGAGPRPVALLAAGVGAVLSLLLALPAARLYLHRRRRSLNTGQLCGRGPVEDSAHLLNSRSVSTVFSPPATAHHRSITFGQHYPDLLPEPSYQPIQEVGIVETVCQSTPRPLR